MGRRPPSCLPGAWLLTAGLCWLIPSEVAATVYIHESDTGGWTCSAPTFAEFQQCHCEEGHGCCLSGQPSWWVKWSVCGTTCCSQLGTVAIATAVFIGLLMLLLGCGMGAMCYFGKCGTLCPCLNCFPGAARNFEQGSLHTGVMFIPNTAFDNGDEVHKLDELNKSSDRDTVMEVPGLKSIRTDTRPTTPSKPSALPYKGEQSPDNSQTAASYIGTEPEP